MLVQSIGEFGMAAYVYCGRPPSPTTTKGAQNAGSALGTFLADNFDVVIRGVGLVPGDWDDELERLTN